MERIETVSVREERFWERIKTGLDVEEFKTRPSMRLIDI
jgi:hypothetical protein